MWVEKPEKPGLYWVYRKATKTVLAASVFRLMGEWFACPQGEVTEGQLPDDQIPLDALAGKVLFYPAEVPPPPSFIQDEAR